MACRVAADRHLIYRDLAGPGYFGCCRGQCITKPGSGVIIPKDIAVREKYLLLDQASEFKRVS